MAGSKDFGGTMATSARGRTVARGSAGAESAGAPAFDASGFTALRSAQACLQPRRVRVQRFASRPSLRGAASLGVALLLSLAHRGEGHRVQPMQKQGLSPEEQQQSVIFDATLESVTMSLKELKGRAGQASSQVFDQKVAALAKLLDEFDFKDEEDSRDSAAKAESAAAATEAAEKQAEQQQRLFEMSLKRSEDRRAKLLQEKLSLLAKKFDIAKGQSKDRYSKVLEEKLVPLSKVLVSMKEQRAQLIERMSQFEQRQSKFMNEKVASIQQELEVVKKQAKERQNGLFDQKFAPLVLKIDSLKDKQSKLVDDLKAKEKRKIISQASTFIWEIQHPKTMKDKFPSGRFSESPDFYLRGIGPFRLEVYPSGRQKEQDEPSVYLYGSAATSAVRIKPRFAVNGKSEAYQNFVQVDDEYGQGKEKMPTPWPTSDKRPLRIEVEFLEVGYAMKTD